MSETPHNPESSHERFMSPETLTDVQGKIDRMVFEDSERVYTVDKICASHRKSKDGIEEILHIRWNKDDVDGNENPIHALVELQVGLEGKVGTSETYTIGTVPESCWYEFTLGDETYRTILSETEAKILIARVHSFIPATGM